MDPAAPDRLNAVDRLNLAACVVLAALVVHFRQALNGSAVWLLAILGKLVVLLLLLAFMAPRGPRWRVAHDFSAIVFVIVLFTVLGPIIDVVRPERWDLVFAQLDVRLVGQMAAQWRSALGHPDWLTDLAYVFYFAYYVTPVVVAALAYRQRRDEFPRFVFALVLTFYASYAGYFVFPTVGPRVPVESESLVIGGSLVSDAARAFIHFAERTQTDAFPSGHTAIGLVCLALAWELSPRAGIGVAIVAAGTIFATVYLHYHYVVDVIAGVALANGCLWVSAWVEAAFSHPFRLRKVAPRVRM